MEINKLRVYSCYYSPNDSYDVFLKNLDDLEDSIRKTKGQLLMAGDFNSKSPEWGLNKLGKRGVAVSELMERNGLIVQNQRQTYTFRRGDTGSVVDLTFTNNIKLHEWIVLEDITLSDHQYITYELRLRREKRAEGCEIRGWASKKLDKERVCELLRSGRQNTGAGATGCHDAENLVKEVTKKITDISQ